MQSGVGVVRFTVLPLESTSSAGATEAYSEDIGRGKESVKSDSRGALSVGRLLRALLARWQDGQPFAWQDPHKGSPSLHCKLNPAPFASLHRYSTFGRRFFNRS